MCSNKCNWKEMLKEKQPDDNWFVNMWRKKCFSFSISSEGVSNKLQSKALLDEYLISFLN